MSSTELPEIELRDAGPNQSEGEDHYSDSSDCHEIQGYECMLRDI